MQGDEEVALGILIDNAGDDVDQKKFGEESSKRGDSPRARSARLGQSPQLAIQRFNGAAGEMQVLRVQPGDDGIDIVLGKRNQILGLDIVAMSGHHAALSAATTPSRGGAPATHVTICGMAWPSPEGLNSVVAALGLG